VYSPKTGELIVVTIFHLFRAVTPATGLLDGIMALAPMNKAIIAPAL
jgi:hypothetical protein